MASESINAAVRDGKVVLTPTLNPGTETDLNVEFRVGGETATATVHFNGTPQVVNPGDMSYTIDPSSKQQKAGKPITLVITSELNGGDVVASANTISITEHEDGKTFTLRSNDPISEDVTFTCSGFNNLVVPVEFTPGDVLSFSYSPSQNTTTDVPVEITVSGTTETVECENDDPLTANVVKTSDYVFTVTPLKAGTINLTFRGAGVQSIIETMTISNPDTIQVTANPDWTANAETPITLTVTGTTKAIQATSSKPDIATVGVQDHEVTVTPTGKVGFTYITISGAGVKPWSKELSFTAIPLKDLQVTVTPSNSVVQGNPITIEVTTPLNGKTITATAKNGSTIVANPNGTTFTVTSDVAQQEEITLTGEGFNPKVVQLTYTAGVVVSGVTVETDSGSQTNTTHSDERFNITIPNSGSLQVDQFKAVSSDTSVATVKYETTGRSRAKQGKVIVNPVGVGTAVITVSGPGIQPIEETLTFTQAVINPQDTEITFSVDPVDGRTDIGETIKITTNVDLQAGGFTIMGETNEISYEVDNMNNQVLNVTSAKADTTSIKIVKTGYKTVTVPVEFIDPNAVSSDFVYILSETSARCEVNKNLEIRAYYNEEIVKCECSDKQVKVNICNAFMASVEDGQGGFKNVAVCEFVVSSSSVGKKTFTLKGSDNKTSTFTIEFFEDEVNEYMALNEQVLTLKKGEEKYILAEVANEDSEIKVTSKAITRGDITVRQEANRIYVTGVNEGTYYIKVEHPTYRTSTFQVLVTAETYVAPQPAPAREYYDLGEAPVIALTSVTSDNFVEKVMDSSETDAGKIAYILSKIIEYPAYGNIVNQLCKAAQALKDEKLSVKQSGSALVASTLNTVISVPDYIVFKQTMKAVKLVFKHYSATSLSEDSVKGNLADDKKYEFVSDLYTFIEKDINGQLKSINVNAMTNSIDHKAKERLKRYVYEA